MECFVALLFFGFIALLVSGAGLGLGPQSSARAYQALTRRFGGNYRGGQFFRRPAVRFRYGPTWVTISPGPRRGQSRTTQAHLLWPDVSTDLQVNTKATYNRTVLGRAVRDVSVGDEDFDRRYHVVGQPEEAVVKILSDGVRWQIDKLCQFFDTPFINISISNGRLTIEKPVLFRRSEDLEQFTQLCLELFDQAMLTRSEGIEFTSGSDEAQVICDPVCQVCGEEIVSDMVFCRRCRTPHHLDCWQYTGSCSTYGCRETRYAIPAVARPVSTPDEDESEGAEEA